LATVALIPGRPSAVRAVTTGHGAWLQQRCAGAVVDPVVTNNGDSGAGSLRQAIMDACDGSTITFGNTVTSPITLTTATLVINKNLTITGPGPNLLTVERSSLAGTPLFRIFTINSGVTVTISGLTITNGHTPDACFCTPSGGGIFNSGTLTVTNCTISGNSSRRGGGIFNAGGALFTSPYSLTVTNSTISGNQATPWGDGDGSGGGIFNDSGAVTVTNSTISGNSAFGGRGGGGIFNSLGAVTVTNSTISDNSAFGNLGGGGIFNDGFEISGVLTVTNSTISGNKSSGDGGGIFLYNFGILRLTNSTISGNQAFGGLGGGICNLSQGAWPFFRARANIIAGNSGSSRWADVSGSFASEGFNVIGKTDETKNGFTQVTDQTGIFFSPLDPMLGPLANNGGPTQTHALLAGSPAIDAGDDSVLGSPLFLITDQRGFPRKLGSHVDIGAFEAEVSPSDSIKQLIPVVDGFNLQPAGIGVSLDAKLNAALSALAAGDTATACVDLSDFIDTVNAQSGKKLTDTQADALRAFADSIRTALGCP